jgi:excisionase family DNA binding protein
MSLEHSPARQRKSAAGRLPLLLRVDDAAHELAISQRRIYQLIKDGTLDLVKIGEKSSRVTSASVMRVASGRAKPGPNPVPARGEVS